jgi:hypothetical protein
MFILPACSSTLPASTTAHDCKWKDEMSDAAYCPGSLSQYGSFCGDVGKVMTEPQAAAPVVGWQTAKDPGTEPLACWEWAGSAQRAYVNFDFSTLKGAFVISAKLAWDFHTDIYEDGGIAGAPLGSYKAPDTTVCYGVLYAATTYWSDNAFETQGDWYKKWPWPTSIPSGQDHAYVTDPVRFTVSQDLPPSGFFFTPVRDDLPNWTSQRCLTTLNNLRLEVIFIPALFHL